MNESVSEMSEQMNEKKPTRDLEGVAEEIEKPREYFFFLIKNRECLRKKRM